MNNKFNVTRLNMLISLSILLVLIILGYSFYIIAGDIISTIISILVPFIMGGLLAYLLNPLCDFINEKFKINRGLSAILSLVLTVSIIVTFIMVFVPILTAQIISFKQSLPNVVNESKEWILGLKIINNDKVMALMVENFESITSKIVETIQSNNIIQRVINSILGTLSSIVGILINLFFIPLSAIYIMTDYYKFKEIFIKKLSVNRKEEIIKLLDDIDDVVRIYLRGLSLSALFVGLASGLGFKILGIEYAFMLGIFCGVFNVIPYIGPYIGMIPALLMALSKGPMVLLGVIIVVLIVQQIEGNIVTPKIQGKGLGIHPLFILISVTIFGSFFGVFSMIIAIPATAILKILYIYFSNKIKKRCMMSDNKLEGDEK